MYCNQHACLSVYTSVRVTHINHKNELHLTVVHVAVWRGLYGPPAALQIAI